MSPVIYWPCSRISYAPEIDNSNRFSLFGAQRGRRAAVQFSEDQTWGIVRGSQRKLILVSIFCRLVTLNIAIIHKANRYMYISLHVDCMSNCDIVVHSYRLQCASDLLKQLINFSVNFNAINVCHCVTMNSNHTSHWSIYFYPSDLVNLLIYCSEVLLTSTILYLEMQIRLCGDCSLVLKLTPRYTRECIYDKI